MHAHAATVNPRSVLERHCIEAIDSLQKMSWKHGYTSKITTVCLYPVYILHLPFTKAFLYSDLVRQQHKSDELLNAQDKLLFTPCSITRQKIVFALIVAPRWPRKAWNLTISEETMGATTTTPMTSMRACSTSLTVIHF